MKPMKTTLFSWFFPFSRKIHTLRWQNIVSCMTILRVSTQTVVWWARSQPNGVTRRSSGLRVTHTFSSSLLVLLDLQYILIFCSLAFLLLGIELPSFVPDSFIIFLQTIQKVRYCCSDSIIIPECQFGISYLSWHFYVGEIMRNRKDWRLVKVLQDWNWF